MRSKPSCAPGLISHVFSTSSLAVFILSKAWHEETMTSPIFESATEPQNLIDGTWRPSLSGEVFTHVSPCQGTLDVSVPSSNLIDVVQMIQAMNRAHTAWMKEPKEDRITRTRTMLSSFLSKIEIHREELAGELAIDIGMPLKTGLSRALPGTIEILKESLRIFDENTKKPSAPPSGHAAVFLGWTDPITNFSRRIPMILAAGNGVCVKPSSTAPRAIFKVSELFRQAMQEANVPSGLFALLFGAGASAQVENNDEAVGPALLRHPGLKTIYWIGSTDHALKARDTAELHGKRFHFTGSGRNPAILFPGFDDGTLDEILANLASAIADPHGLGPYRPSRLFIHESIYKSSLESLAQKLSSLRSGSPLSKDTDLGPLPRREIERFQNQTRLALSETGHKVVGGETEGEFAMPTLIRDLTNCSTLQSEELAGPWATAASFKYAHEALKYANTSPLGLAGFVIHPDTTKAQGVAEKLEAARVFFSTSVPWPRALTEPTHCVKHSGNGDDGIRAILEFSRWNARYF